MTIFIIALATLSMVALCLVLIRWIFSWDIEIVHKDREASQWLQIFAIPLGALMPVSRSLLSRAHHERLQAQLIQAGKQYEFSSINFFTFQLFLSLVMMVVGGLTAFVCDASLLGVLITGIIVGGLVWGLSYQWLIDRIKFRHQQVLLALPFVLDMITLCVEAGLNLQSALQQTVDRGPKSPLTEELGLVLAEIRTGVTRAQALRHMSVRLNEPHVKTWVASLIHAEALGLSLAPLLRSQADQRRKERFLRAEKLALQAPVKMLFPLAICIFPCTFLVLGFPLLMQLWPHL